MGVRRLFICGVTAAPLLFRLLAQSPDSPAVPPAGSAIQIPPDAGLQLKYHFLAVGKQIYTCESGAWNKNSTPAATLYDLNSNLKIRHSAGPAWTTADGKSTVRANGATAKHFAAPDGVSIDWLKLEADPASRTGDFSGVRSIQRVYTGGGKAPTSSCTTNQIYEAPYTAHYYFWSSK
jgi:hypothetical protein